MGSSLYRLPAGGGGSTGSAADRHGQTDGDHNVSTPQLLCGHTDHGVGEHSTRNVPYRRLDTPTNLFIISVLHKPLHSYL